MLMEEINQENSIHHFFEIEIVSIHDFFEIEIVSTHDFFKIESFDHQGKGITREKVPRKRKGMHWIRVS